MLVPVPVPSGSVEIALLDMEEGLRTKLSHLEQTERRLRHFAALSRKVAAHAARIQLEKERQRLGRELHTGVGQLLAAVKIQVELIDQYLPERSERVEKALERITALAGDALDQVRSVSRELYFPEWQRIPLPQAIEALWERSGVAQRFGGTLKLLPLPCTPDARTKALAYRAAQEGISNVIRHSRATSVTLTLEYSDGKIRVTVEDNGVGSKQGVESGAGAGMGLRALRDEAEAMGAEMAIESCNPGTKLKVSVPAC